MFSWTVFKWDAPHCVQVYVTMVVNGLNINIYQHLFFFRDYQRKQNTLKVLKRKALDRNPDEFYFNMVKTQKVVSSFVYLW